MSDEEILVSLDQWVQKMLGGYINERSMETMHAIAHHVIREARSGMFTAEDMITFASRMCGDDFQGTVVSQLEQYKKEREHGEA